jgi:RNA polymerase sigma factor (sigma-70 family)
MRNRLGVVVAHLRRMAVRQGDGVSSDARLLERFVANRDEAAFEVLVWRHGPMILGVCRRVLRGSADVEDVFHATFLTLVRQARSIAQPDALAGWLYRVAYRTALRARARQAKLAAGPTALDELTANLPDECRPEWDVLQLIDEEMQRLPEKYRRPLVLSYFQGRTNQEIASNMACPIGTVFTRLSRGRELLRRRLARRGVTASAGLFAAALASTANSAPLPSGLVAQTVKIVAAFAVGSSTAAISLAVVSLTNGVCKMMWLTRLAWVGVPALLLALATAGGLRVWGGNAAPQQDRYQAALVVAALPEAEPVAQPQLPQPERKEPRDRPKILEVFPPNGAVNVEPITDIRIRFDRPMDPAAAYLTWEPLRDLTARTGFRLRGDMQYNVESHEFVLPVELVADAKHVVTANSSPGGPVDLADEREHEGFQSVTKIAARDYRWTFHTKKLPTRPGRPALATVVSPKPDTEVPLITSLEVSFDQAMDPTCYGISGHNTSPFDAQPNLMGPPKYDPTKRSFTLLLQLPPNWNGEIKLDGFRDTDGIEAKPLVVKYRTMRAVLAAERRVQIASLGTSVEFRQLLDRIRKARRDLTSVSEEVLFGSVGNHGAGSAWLLSYHLEGTRLRMQGGQQFVGEIDDIMRMPFRIGRDGATCWMLRGQELFKLPAQDFKSINTLFCDAFDAFSDQPASTIIHDHKLEFLGEWTIRGRACYGIRSWDINPERFSSILDWYIDKQTLLPLRVGTTRAGMYHWYDYTHTQINQKIPDAEFRPPALAGVKEGKPEPLTEGYTSRFLNVIDGSNGRMSVRWGMQGPAGQSSSGLN